MDGKRRSGYGASCHLLIRCLELNRIWQKREPLFSDCHRLGFSEKKNGCLLPRMIKAVVDENSGELSDEDDELCPVDCVREFKTDEEFCRILEKAKETGSLVVVDFYRTSCGSCKYIEQGFTKLCKGSCDQEAPVIFLKHNVLDEYDEQSEVAEDSESRLFLSSTSIKMECCWNHSLPGTKRGLMEQF